MKKVAFTIVNDEYFYNAGAHIFINSFKRFHPDIPLVVFRQDKIEEMFISNQGLNFYNSKPSFAKLLTDKYDMIVNMDCDHVICGRMSTVFDDESWEVGAAWNYNRYENASFENITEKMYLQAGLVGSTNSKFWDEWEVANKDAMKYVRKENDVLNKVVYGDGVEPKYKLKIYDRDFGYIGCKSLALEGRMYVEGDKIMLDGEVVWAYHHAKGKDFPKLRFHTMGFTWEVQQKLEEFGLKGVSITVL